MSTGSFIADLNGILVSDLVARAQIKTTEIAVIDNGSNGDASYALIMAQEVEGQVSVVIEEFFSDMKMALCEFSCLLECEAGLPVGGA